MSELKGKIDHPAFTGELSEVPLFAVLRQIQRARLTGRLQLSRAEQWRWLFFESGELRAARSSVEEHRLGATLLSWGYLTRRDLDRALQAQRSGGMRLDELLVEMGLVSRTVLDAESRRLMEHIVSSALSWSAGNFRFEANAGGGHEDIAFSLS
ncbi:MAG TPA: DUF4388 domain-containing protein, partial [Thermoanaerobaculia bacterium]